MHDMDLTVTTASGRFYGRLPDEPENGSGIKIRCASPDWSARVQMLLNREIGAEWGMGQRVPWNTERLFLIVRPRERGGWNISWATPLDFAQCPLPEWTAEALVAAAPDDNDEAALGPSIMTPSGYPFYFRHPSKSIFSIFDIAHNLAHICRFTGATRTHYSVAQHSVLVSYAVPKRFAMEGLMHDGGEAFVGDVSQPLKSMLPGYKEIEQEVEAEVLTRFGLPVVLDPAVKRGDLILLSTEKRDLMPRRLVLEWDAAGKKPLKLGARVADDWGASMSFSPLKERIKPLPAAKARKLFLERYAELRAQGL